MSMQHKCAHRDFACARGAGLALHIKANHPEHYVKKPAYTPKRGGGSIRSPRRKPKRKYTRRSSLVGPRCVEATRSASMFSIDEAVALLCDVIVARVEGTLSAKLEPLIAERIGVAAVKLAPVPAEIVKPSGLRSLEDKDLRLELLRAKGCGDTDRATKIVKEFSRRHSSASAIETESRDTD